MEQAFIRNGYADPSHACELLRYSIYDLNNLLMQILYAYVDKETNEDINQFLIVISQQKLLDKILVNKEIWSIFHSLEEHRNNSIESEILYKIFNGEYNDDMIPFYVQARRIVIQHVFGDHHMDKNSSLDNVYISPDKLSCIGLRMFERFLPDRALAISIGNVIRSLDTLSFSSSEEISALDFMHFWLIEYQRLQFKSNHDEEIMYRQRERKLSEIYVPLIDDMFYRDPAIIIRNFDYSNHYAYSPPDYGSNIGTTVNGVEIDESLLRIAAPSSKFQNNPPKTREEQRKEQKLKEKQSNEPKKLDLDIELPPQAPKVVKGKKILNAQPDDVNDQGLPPKVRSSRIIGSGAAGPQSHNIFSQSDREDMSSYSPPEKNRGLETNQKRSNDERSSNYNLSPHNVPGIFTLGAGTHSTSQRSLFRSVGRNEDIEIAETQQEPLLESESEPDNEKKQEFSNFLSSAATK